MMRGIMTSAVRSMKPARDFGLIFLLCAVSVFFICPSSAYSALPEKRQAETGLQSLQVIARNVDPATEKRIRLGIGKLGIPFVVNEGQVRDTKVKFYANTFAGTVFVEDSGGITYELASGEGKKSYVIKERLLNLLQKPVPEGTDKAAAKVSYFYRDRKR